MLYAIVCIFLPFLSDPITCDAALSNRWLNLALLLLAALARLHPSEARFCYNLLIPRTDAAWRRGRTAYLCRAPCTSLHRCFFRCCALPV